MPHALLFSLSCLMPASLPPRAVLYTGAVFVTQDPALPTAHALLVAPDGTIQQVYATAPATLPLWAQRVDLGGGTVVPGLHDAHAHLRGVGKLHAELDVTGTQTAADVARAVAQWISAHPGQPVTGRGWDQNDWSCAQPPQSPCGGQMPQASLLDPAAPDVPVMLRRVDGHAVWVNGKVLRDVAATRAGAALAPGGKDPPGGRILRHANGQPTGVLVDAAMELVNGLLPPDGPAQIRQQLALGADAAAQAGLTAVHDMGTTREELAALRALDDDGALPIRVFVYLDGSDRRAVASLPASGPVSGPVRVMVRGVKLYADGALGSRGARLAADYSDEPGHRGLWVTQPADLAKVIRKVHARHHQVAIHAIGDAANHQVLALFAALKPNGTRHRVEHAQVVDPADFAMFARTGAFASMQPTHCTSDMPWAPQRLGPARLAGAYAWKSLMNAGAVLAFGSDAPVESIRPLLGLYAATTRMDEHGSPPHGYTPAERLDPAAALAAFTTGAAQAAGQTGGLGQLKAGAPADFTWLEDNPLTVPAARLLTLKVRGTCVAGQLYRRGNPP